MIRKLSRGFTLMELMVVVAIVAILASIAIPSYSEYSRRVNRAAAEEFVQRVANREKQFLLDYRSYTDLAGLGLDGAIPAEVSRHYCITATSTGGPPPTFLVKATPRLSSVLQTGQPSFTLDETGTFTEAAESCA